MFLLFPKMADELTKPPHNRKPIVPKNLGWQSLLEPDGDELEVHYRHVLEELGKKPGMGAILKKARRRFKPGDLAADLGNTAKVLLAIAG